MPLVSFFTPKNITKPEAQKETNTKELDNRMGQISECCN